jgi:archaeosine synthase
MQWQRGSDSIQPVVRLIIPSHAQLLKAPFKMTCMLSLSFMDGYRTGTFAWNGKKAAVPNLLKVDKNILHLEDITIERPTLYKKTVDTDLKTVPLLRIPYSAPKDIASTFTEANLTFLSQKKDACPVYISRYRSLTDHFLSQLPYCDIFFVFCSEERRLLRALFELRKKYPKSLLFTQAQPEEIPVFLNAGIDLFEYTEENAEALQRFFESPTKEYLEKECNSSVKTKRLLRLLYRECYRENEKYIAFKKRKELYISNDSLYRPEVERFRQRIRERYTPPSNIVVLFPCSARKPYSTSKSHRLFRTAVPRNANITELVLTSPLGVVPRELEDYVNYDIPVTGHWSHEEVKEAASLLEDVLRRVNDPVVYAHLPREYMRICESLPFDITYTVIDNPLSRTSLDTLFSHLQSVERKSFLERKMRAVSEFLFNEDIFPEKIKVKGRRTKYIEADNILGRYTDELRLTQAGADLVNNYCVHIDFTLKGDVFCPGVISADPCIRPGEQVIIKRGRAVGVGRAVLPGALMTEVKGMAVKVKKRFANAGESHC